eukprot:4253147-Pleurochrysis_carterae.AAC.2
MRDAHSPSPQKRSRTRRQRRRALPVFSRVAALPRDPTAPPAPSNLASSSTTAFRGPPSSPAGDARRPKDQQSSGKPEW